MTFPLSRAQTERYSRQLLIPGFGVQGQLGLLKGSVLIVGCGGLGSPCALYLASSGVGRIGLLDFDVVDVSNLHRQIIHNHNTLGLPKTQSAAQSILALNPSVHVVQHATALDDAGKALEIIKEYDVVVDASDNVLTRYLVNDVCMHLGKALVSGSALRWEGHLTTFLPRRESPCYRCLYPTPTPPSAVTNCESGGILPPVVGTIGTLQAMEVIRLLSGHSPNYAGKMLLYDAATGNFRTVKLRGSREECAACNNAIDFINFDYRAFSGSGVCDKALPLKLLSPEERVTVQQYNLQDYQMVIDVRPKEQFEICSLSGSVNIQLDSLESIDMDKAAPILTVCRRGNQSQKAVIKLKSLGYTNVKDLIGGVTAYAQQIDPEFPLY